MSDRIRLNFPTARKRRFRIPRLRFSLRMMMLAAFTVSMLVGGWIVTERHGLENVDDEMKASGINADSQVVFPFVVAASYFDFNPLTSESRDVTAYYVVFAGHVALLGHVIQDLNPPPEQRAGRWVWQSDGEVY